MSNEDNTFAPIRRSSRLTGQSRPIYNQNITEPNDEIAPPPKRRGQPSKNKAPIKNESSHFQIKTPTKKESKPLQTKTPTKKESQPLKIKTPTKFESSPFKIKTPPRKESPPFKVKKTLSFKRVTNKSTIQAKKKDAILRMPILTGMAYEYEDNIDENGHVKKCSKVRLNEAIRAFNKHYLLSVQEEQRRVQAIQEARAKKKQEEKEEQSVQDIEEPRMKKKANGKKKEKEKKEKTEKNPSQRPDLKAITKMNENQTMINHVKRIGHIPGIEVGDKFYSRAEMVIVGMHSHWFKGIDYMSKDYEKVYPEYEFPLAVCVVLSGQYEDDLDKDDTIVYTGQGGNNLLGDKKQFANQHLKFGNLALANNCECKVPVRLVRGQVSEDSYTKKEYSYSGLYMVEKYWAEEGAQNFTVYKFMLKRLEGQKQINTAEVKFVRQGIPQTCADLKGLVCNDISNGQERLPIPATNTVDNEPFPPPGFTYSKSLQIPSHFTMPKTVQGCKCIGDCSKNSDCPCAKMNGSDFVYVRPDKKMREGARLVEAKSIVFECGDGCKCSSCCINRTSQQGLKYHLEVFKTANKGWGVKTWDTIPAGAPVCEYTGILRKTDDADSNHAGNNYIFDIDCIQTIKGLEGRETRGGGDVSFVTKDMESNAPEYCIDGVKVGNVTRFINHSCQPNLFVQCVLSSHRDFKLANIVLFAADTIRPLQELTYDYGYQLNSVVGPDGKVRELACHCGAAECRKRLY